MQVEQLEQVQEVIEMLMAEVGLDNIPAELEVDLEAALSKINEAIEGAQNGNEEEGTDPAMGVREGTVVRPVASELEPAGMERIAE
jgi:hypothetical protein